MNSITLTTAEAAEVIKLLLEIRHSPRTVGEIANVAGILQARIKEAEKPKPEKPSKQK